jgi:hypothetical protein
MRATNCFFFLKNKKLKTKIVTNIYYIKMIKINVKKKKTKNSSFFFFLLLFVPNVYLCFYIDCNEKKFILIAYLALLL